MEQKYLFGMPEQELFAMRKKYLVAEMVTMASLLPALVITLLIMTKSGSLLAPLAVIVIYLIVGLVFINPKASKAHMNSLDYSNKFISAVLLLLIILCVILLFVVPRDSIWRGLPFFIILLTHIINRIYRLYKLEDVHREQVEKEGTSAPASSTI
ncbi:hypothetical protein ACGCUQ_06875 [Eubacteriales bacterium KG127]